jgi:hypothetical protein
MSSSEIDELRGLIKSLDQKVDDRFGALNEKLDNMMVPLRKIQGRYLVDNPVGRWRGLGRALLSMFRANNEPPRADPSAAGNSEGKNQCEVRS